MIPDPLHPAVVHFPIVFALVLPIVAIVAVLRARSSERPRSAWMTVVALSIALVGSAWLSVATGERDEEPVERVVAESVLHDHEEAGELFLGLSVGVAALVVFGLLGGRAGLFVRYAGTVAILLLPLAAFRVGHSGGSLVYEYGAATAHVSRQTAAEGRLGPPSEDDRNGPERDSRDDDDDRGDRPDG